MMQVQRDDNEQKCSEYSYGLRKELGALNEQSHRNSVALLNKGKP